mmetsp:Transcript_7138/g.15993  ORF Transcript_7138/g.15993 Transcript_7138/m.15993 type:complete len:81 (+) Transcript_7138:595-837(+)
MHAHAHRELQVEVARLAAIDMRRDTYFGSRELLSREDFLRKLFESSTAGHPCAASAMDAATMPNRRQQQPPTAAKASAQP